MSQIILTFVHKVVDKVDFLDFQDPQNQEKNYCQRGKS